jgi:predicted helicase
MFSKTDVHNAEAIADKYVRMCCEMLAQGGLQPRRYRKFASLLEDIVEDELDAFFKGRNSSLKSVQECDILYYIGELYDNFIEPMYMDHCIPKTLKALPKVDLTSVKKVRRAKTTKTVVFGC